MYIIGIDTGGTFTDFVLLRDGKLSVHKVLSTPDAPERAILQGLNDMGLLDQEMRMVHGSTVATNAALEGKGVRTAFITNRGFADLLSIGRQNRRELYNLQPEPEAQPVPQSLCLETAGRLDADGNLIEPLSDDDLDLLSQQLEALKPEAVAVCLLFSYLDDSAEQAIARMLPHNVFRSLSSEVLPEIKEYERAMATWLNAWIGPRVQGYLLRLTESLPAASVAVMQSSGETLAAEQAAQQAVRMLLSGPAGGLVAARYMGKKAGIDKLLTFDMGGTSTDVALIDGDPRLTSEGRIGPYPVSVPMVDMHTIGAGGGSIAWLDEGGMLQVGPESAGADPGPAAYARGGKNPTVTDANLVLGRLRADDFLGGDMSLDLDAARRVIKSLADKMSCSLEEAALGIVRIANAHMVKALRTISVQRGIDPRGFSLVSFGGAGGLHVCALAEALGLQKAMVPIQGGVLSALGMILARPGRQLSRTSQMSLSDADEHELLSIYDEIERQGIKALEDEGVAREECEFSRSMDLRYQGQAYTLNLPFSGLHEMPEKFHNRHEERYGHALDVPVELVNLRSQVAGPVKHIELTSKADGDGHVEEYVSLVGVEQGVPLYRRPNLKAGQMIQGPALITERVSTSWLSEGWQAEVDDLGNLLLSRISN